MIFPSHADTVNGFSFHPYMPLAATSSGHRRFKAPDEGNGDTHLTGSSCNLCAAIIAYNLKLPCRICLLYIGFDLLVYFFLFVSPAQHLLSCHTNELQFPFDNAANFFFNVFFIDKFYKVLCLHLLPIN